MMRVIFVIRVFLALAFTPAQAFDGGSPVQPSGLKSILPNDWVLEPRDPNWRGTRLRSPDGTGWIAVYEGPAGSDVADHMNTVAFADGETMTYLRRGQSWVVASGFKGNRIFYRKAMLACANTRWHHIALEYPATEKRAYDRFVSRASRALGAHRNDGCKQPSDPGKT